MLRFRKFRLPTMSRTIPFEHCDHRLHRVYDYWQAKRGARAMPARVDVDPGELRSELPYLMLTDVVDGGRRFRYRLFGTAVADAFGMDPTGRFVDEVMSDPKYRAFIIGLYRDIVTKKRPICSTTRYGSHRDVEMWTQRLMMPLSSDGMTVDMVLSIQVFTHASPLKTQTVRLAQDKAEPIASLHDLLE